MSRIRQFCLNGVQNMTERFRMGVPLGNHLAAVASFAGQAFPWDDDSSSAMHIDCLNVIEQATDRRNITDADWEIGVFDRNGTGIIHEQYGRGNWATIYATSYAQADGTIIVRLTMRD
jgi:hypothetical protein